MLSSRKKRSLSETECTDDTQMPKRTKERDFEEKSGRLMQVQERKRNVLATENVEETEAKRIRTASISDEVIEVKEVYDRLIKAQVQWFDLGLSLGLDYNTLIQIDMEHCGESSACLYGMITERLKFDSPLTWKVLCDCLRKITVRRYDVALEIQQEIEDVPKDKA